MTRFESRKRKIDWDSITKWEEDNKSLVIWALTIDCIRDRMKETDQDFVVHDNLIYEFCYHTRRGWDMEKCFTISQLYVIIVLTFGGCIYGRRIR